MSGTDEGLRELRRSLMALRLELPEPVWDHHAAIVDEAINSLGAALRGLANAAEQYLDTGRGDLDGWLALAREALGESS